MSDVRNTTFSPECRRLSAFVLEHSCIRPFMNSVHGVFTFARYFKAKEMAEGEGKKNEAARAVGYLDDKYSELQDLVASMPLLFRSNCGEGRRLVQIGMASEADFGGNSKGSYLWKEQPFQEMVVAESLRAFLGPVNYAKLTGRMYFAYLRTVFAELKLDATMPNEKADELIAGETPFQSSFGDQFGVEVKKVWVGNQAVDWVSRQEVNHSLKDFTDAQKIITTKLIRIYSGLDVTRAIELKYGRWRPSMVQVPRIAD